MIQRYDIAMDTGFSMQQELYKKQVISENDCIKKVLTLFLGREAIIEDAKRCSIIMKSGIHELCYDNIHLGTIKRSFYHNILKVEFIPKVHSE